MLNAKARSKAKLPICAMLGQPQSIFSESGGGGNRKQMKQSHGKTRAGQTKCARTKSTLREVGQIPVNVSAARRRPGLGRQGGICAPLGALLVITLAYFAFGDQPVFGFVTWLKSATLSE